MKWIILSSLFFMSSGALAEDKVMLANIDYGLSDEKIAELSAQAMSGSAEASARLSDKYFYDSGADRKRTRERALYWALIGAENGSADAQFRAYQLLRSNADKNDQIRAFFWLKTAAKKRHQLSKWTLAECPALDSSRPSGIPCFGPGSDG